MNTNVTETFTQEDIGENKVMAILSWIGFLWLVPFLTKKDSPFVKFNLNQALIFFIVAIAGGIVSTILGFIPAIGWILSLVVWLAVAALGILGIINAIKGEGRELPFVGGIRIIK